MTVKDVIERTKYNFIIENSKGIIIYDSFDPESYNLFNNDTKVASLAPGLINTNNNQHITYIKIVTE